jgi:hypothetical protein
LFSDGGYYLENGVTLCEKHHLEAEQTVIEPSQFYELLGVKRVLPDQLYDEFEYTKWGDIIMPNGTRLIGPLFFDESVQKIMASAPGILSRYSKRIKYSRTFHLPWSESRTEDDRTLQNMDHFKGRDTVASLKMDGEQTAIYWDAYCHARSVDGEAHWTQSYVRNLAAKIGYSLPEFWRIHGENLFAKHSIGYDDLDDFFYMFSIWNEKNQCLSWDETIEWAQMLDLKPVHVFYRGIYDEKAIREAFEPFRSKHEGYVIRRADMFNYSEFKYSMAKFVRKNHVQTTNHWKFERIEKNQLKS